MADVDMKTLTGRLNPVCLKAMESAAGLCLTRQHYQITIEHVLLMLLENTASDLHQIFAQFGVDTAGVKAALGRDLSMLKTGNGGRPAFAAAFADWLQTAWVHASLDFDLAQIRSGVLLLSLLGANGARFVTGTYGSLLKIAPDDLRRQFEDAVAGSSEARTPRLSNAEGPQASQKEVKAVIVPANGPAAGELLDHLARLFASEVQAGRAAFSDEPGRLFVRGDRGLVPEILNALRSLGWTGTDQQQ